MRTNERTNEQLREFKITKDINKYAEGSVLIETGDTKVICTATIEEKVPPFLKGHGKGWITAEYSMLPRATETRNQREAIKGKISGRTMEIQRLIGRALRAVVNLEALGERSILIDCDVIQADGGTRTASINGGFLAMALACAKIYKEGKITSYPINDYLAAISVGIVEKKLLLDLNYNEDSKAEVDMNIVMTGNGRFVEIQGTGEEAVFSEEELKQLISIAKKGIEEIISYEKNELGEINKLIMPNQ